MRELLSRRAVIGGGAVAGIALLAGTQFRSKPAVAAGNFEVHYTSEEWRKRLNPLQYSVLRQGATERSGSSPLNGEKRRGTYVCAGCGLPLFRSAEKYESGTGWPSFTAPIRGAVGTRPDDTLFLRRTEVHCRRCGGHLGHVFDDGPPPRGKRWCMNGAAMRFRPA
jgi:peptide-methionine (R)-S-oxide reductase